MGEGGYGIDQAYLWYKRDGMHFDHDIHLFAFITDDFYRMRYNHFLGYGKPVLDLTDDRVVVRNVPVPKSPYWIPRLADRLRLVEFRSCKLLTDLYQKTPRGKGQNHKLGAEQIKQVALRIFNDLEAVDSGKNSTLVLVYLPIKRDYLEDESDSWRAWLRHESSRRRIELIDLVEEIRTVGPSEFVTMFLKDGHYTVAGNRFIASRLYEKLLSGRELSQKFTARGGVSVTP